MKVWNHWVEKFMVEKYGVEMSYNPGLFNPRLFNHELFKPMVQKFIPRQIFRPTAGIAVNYWKAFFQGKPQTKCPA